MQYGTKGLLGKTFADIEEKYDLSEAADGFGEEGEDKEQDEDTDDSSHEEDSQEEGSAFFEGEAY
jgi:hypothetical protein